MLTSKQRTALRESVGLRATAVHVPVIVVEGTDLPPVLFGEPGGWYTRGGKHIFHPSAYRKRGWSNATYRRSTERVYVGMQWLVDNGFSIGTKPAAETKTADRPSRQPRKIVIR